MILSIAFTSRAQTTLVLAEDAAAIRDSTASATASLAEEMDEIKPADTNLRELAKIILKNEDSKEDFVSL